MAVLGWLDDRPACSAAADAPPATKEKRVGERFSPTEYDAVSQAASDDHRTMSALVRKVMLGWLRAGPIDPPAAA